MSKSISVVKTRDGATSILRKLGIKPRDYDFFIERRPDGLLAVQLHKAKAHLEALAQPELPRQRRQLKQPRAKQEVIADVERPAGEAKRLGRGRPRREDSCASVSQALIRSGKTNTEVWEIIKERFNLDDRKKGYPAWYRSYMRLRGEAV